MGHRVRIRFKREGHILDDKLLELTGSNANGTFRGKHTPVIAVKKADADGYNKKWSGIQEVTMTNIKPEEVDPC